MAKTTITNVPAAIDGTPTLTSVRGASTVARVISIHPGAKDMTDRIIYAVTFLWVACLWVWLGTMWFSFIS